MVFAVILSGVGPVLVRDSPVDPAATAFWRLFVGLPVALYLIRRSILLPRRAMFGVAVAGALLSSDLMLWNTALIKTTILEATILVMVYPVIAAVASYLIFKERITRRLAAGGGIAFLGLLLMVAHNGGSGTSSLEGDLLAIGAAFCYAGSLLISARLCRAYDTMIVSFWLMFFASLTALPFGLIEGRSVPQTPEGWGYILFYAAITLTGYILFNRGLKTVPTGLASLMGYAQPVVATILGVLVLKEVPSWNGILGGIIIILGLVLATREADRGEATKPAQ
ncbi:MAG TPA: EamA family transporter [Candidatus Cybelea sp.]|nr:EamA family transporter [Candidatus Cybelea sp.]